jgi:hypothetical protein
MLDDELQFNKRMLGQGRGPDGLPAKMTNYLFFDNKLFVLGSSYDFYQINNQWNIQSKSRFDFDNQGISLSELQTSPKAQYLGIYEINYPAIQSAFWHKSIVLPIETSHPKFNGYNSSEFYAESYVLALLNLQTSKIDTIFGNYPPLYQSYRFIPQFSNTIFDVENNNLLLGFEADSSIYVLSKPNHIIHKFGFKGRQMEQNYPQVQDYNNYVQIYNTHRHQYGYYKHIKYIPEKQLVFRSYQKGNNEQLDGLQIYQHNNLIADVDVPKDFELVGYIAPYFYAQGSPDQINQKLILYRFKL